MDFVVSLICYRERVVGKVLFYDSVQISNDTHILALLTFYFSYNTASCNINDRQKKTCTVELSVMLFFSGEMQNKLLNNHYLSALLKVVVSAKARNGTRENSI